MTTLGVSFSLLEYSPRNEAWMAFPLPTPVANTSWMHPQREELGVAGGAGGAFLCGLMLQVAPAPAPVPPEEASQFVRFWIRKPQSQLSVQDVALPCCAGRDPKTRFVLLCAHQILYSRVQPKPSIAVVSYYDEVRARNQTVVLPLRVCLCSVSFGDITIKMFQLSVRRRTSCAVWQASGKYSLGRQSKAAARKELEHEALTSRTRKLNSQALWLFVAICSLCVVSTPHPAPFPL